MLVIRAVAAAALLALSASAQGSITPRLASRVLGMGGNPTCPGFGSLRPAAPTRNSWISRRT